MKRLLLLAAVVAAALLGLVLAGVFAAARKGYVLPPVRASQASSSLSLVPVAAPGKILLAYNSGLQIGNDVLLYRATGDASYIQSAEKLAEEGAKTFGRFAYPTPPGNLIAFGFIYLRQLRLLEPYSQVARELYAKQSSEFLAYVHAHVARGRGARSVRQLANGLWIDHESNEGVHIAWVWPAAMIGAAEEDRGLYRTAEALRYYWNGNSWSSATTGSHGVSGVFWDDNVWAALDTISLYQASHDPGALRYVEKNLQFMESGWQHPYGGIRWVNRSYNNDVTAASTLGAEQEALWLYLLTHRAFDLKWAEGVQHWVAQHLTAPNGLIYDHLTPCGPHLEKLCFGRGKIVPRKPGQYDPLLYDAALIG